MEGSTTKCNNFNVSSIEVVALGCGAFQIITDRPTTRIIKKYKKIVGKCIGN